MDKVNINIQIGEYKHPLVVNKDEEPVYREAARLINDRLVAYQTKYRVSKLTPYFVLSFAVLDLVAQYVRLQRDTNVQPVQEAIRALADEIESFNLER